MLKPRLKKSKVEYRATSPTTLKIVPINLETLQILIRTGISSVAYPSTEMSASSVYDPAVMPEITLSLVVPVENMSKKIRQLLDN